jgi:hypothetical protein
MKNLSRIVAISSLVASCGAPPSATTPNGSPSANASATSTSASTPDPGPKLTRRTGKANAEKLPDVQIVAEHRFAAQGHFYVCAPYPTRSDAITWAVWIAVAGDRHAFAAEKGQGNGTELCVRMVGEGAPKGPLRVTVHRRASKDGGGFLGGRVQNVDIVNIDKAAMDPSTKTAFFRAGSETFRNRVTWNSSDPFFSFASGRFVRMGDPKQKQTGVNSWNVGFAPRPELDQLMDLYTGMTSVEEALQTDRGLFGVNAKEVGTIDPKTVNGVPMPAHPWARMQKKLGKQPVVEPLAASVPADMLYAGFHDIRSALVLLRELDTRISPLAQALEHGGGFRNFGERTDEELALQRTGLAEKLGNAAVDGMALATSDPFLREGSDVSVLFGIKQKALLTSALDGFAARSKATHPTQTEKTYLLSGKKVTLISTPDGTVSRHQLELGNVLILSNSKRALERFVSVSEKRAKSLAESEDFRYFRSLAPFEKEHEDGFVFASDDFVRATVSPRTKILEARRLARGADLAAVNHAALLYGWLEGKAPASTADLVKAGYLEQKELVHSDGARIDFDPKRGASSSWGRPARMTSLIDLDLGLVTASEKQAYERFRESYQQYWRGYIDPIGARVSLGADGKKISVDMRILPLIEQSEYKSMLADVGEQHVKIPELGSGLRWVLAIGKDAEIRRMGDRLAGQFSRRRELAFSWVGDWVTAGAADRSGLWDLALQSAQVPEIGSRDKIGDLAMLGRAPIWGAVHVKNRLALAAALTALRAAMKEAAPGITDWRSGGSHRSVEITEIHDKSDSRSKEELTVSYAIVKDVLVVSLDRATLERQIDSVLDGNVPDSKQGDIQSAIELRPASGGFLSRTLMGVIETEALHAHDASLLAYEALARGIPNLPTDRAAVRTLALGYLGTEPVSPFAGEITLTNGLATHSTRGTAVEPIVPAVPEGNGSVLEVVKNIERLSVGIGFEGKGDERGLRTRIEWQRR